MAPCGWIYPVIVELDGGRFRRRGAMVTSETGLAGAVPDERTTGWRMERMDRPVLPESDLRPASHRHFLAFASRFRVRTGPSSAFGSTMWTFASDPWHVLHPGLHLLGGLGCQAISKARRSWMLG